MLSSQIWSTNGSGSGVAVDISGFLRRKRLAGRKALWRVFNDYSPNARLLYIFGAQRSGTTLLLNCFENSMDFEVLGENSHAMENYRIKCNEFIRNTVRSSRHRFIVFKPLTDSHRVRELIGLAQGARAIWAYRRVEDRVNSAIARFGDVNLRILSGLANGEGLEKWQAQGLTDFHFDFIRRFDYRTMSPFTAAAIFWYLRNSLFFSQRLHEDDRVLPLAYEDLVSSPETTMRECCSFIDAQFKPEMIVGVHSKSIKRADSTISEEISELCQPLYERLKAVQRERLMDVGSTNT